MKTVLVTGANGFVGRPLCRRLISAGWRVHGCIRRIETAATLPCGVQPVVVPDISDRMNWSPLLDGVDAVVHLVARTHVLHDTADDPMAAYRRINVIGTGQLLDACIRSGVSRFVFMSSIKAVGEGSPTTYTEATPCRPEDPYGISKREAENLVMETARGRSLRPVILRPPLIYGPEVRGNLLRLLHITHRGVPLPLRWIKNARSMVFVENLASAVEAVLVHPAASGEIFHVADEQSISTPELITCLAELQGRRARLLPCPAWLLRLAGTVLRRQDEVSRLVGSLTVSSRKLRERLQWSPPYSVDEGLRRTVAWFHGTEEAPPVEPSVADMPRRRAA